jgi:hypothetical protein
MIAGEDSETAGIYPEAFMEAEFCTEIGNGFFESSGGIFANPGILCGRVCAETVTCGAHPFEELRIVQATAELLTADPVYHFYGAVVAVFPEERGQFMEHKLGRGIP